jgi:hypothetical protein
MFENSLLLLAWLASTYLLSSIIIGVMDAFREVKGVNGLEARIAKRLDDIIHRVRVEKQENMYYWYDMDDHEFLGQGSTDEEIIASLKSRFPDHMFFLPTNHLICAKTDWQPKQVGK